MQNHSFVNRSFFICKCLYLFYKWRGKLGKHYQMTMLIYQTTETLLSPNNSKLKFIINLKSQNWQRCLQNIFPNKIMKMLFSFNETYRAREYYKHLQQHRHGTNLKPDISLVSIRNVSWYINPRLQKVTTPPLRILFQAAKTLVSATKWLQLIVRSSFAVI